MSTRSDASTGFDPRLPYRRSASVALRPEPFGALVYDFVTRKLSFLKTPELVQVVTGLENHPDVHAAIEAAGVPERIGPPICVPCKACWPAARSSSARP